MKYTAPAAPGSCTLVASSVVDSSASGRAVVVVEEPSPVNSVPVIAGFSVSPDAVVAGAEVTFSWDVADVDGDVLVCSLDVDGDGSLAYVVDDCGVEVSQVHRFLSSGDRVARLSVSDGVGSSDAEVGVAVAVNPRPAWVRQFGTSGIDKGYGVALDGGGNTFVTGYTLGSLEGSNAGSSDVFLAKFDGGGSQLWVRQFGSSEGESGYGVAVDGAGNAFVAGPGSPAVTNAGSAQVFLAKFDGDGVRLWVRQFGTTGDHGEDVTVDESGNAYVVGYTYGSLDGSNAGGPDVFLAKFDGGGSQLWVRQFGSSDSDRPQGVAVDGAGNAYVTGTTDGSLEGSNAGSSDVFLAKYDANGFLLWLRQFGSSDYEIEPDVAVDATGSAYVTGTTNGSVAGNSAGGSDMFLAKYGGDGVRRWLRQFGSDGSDRGRTVAVDGVGSVLVAGIAGRAFDGSGAGFVGPFLAEYDGDGVQQWIRPLIDDAQMRDMAVDGQRGAYFAGSTYVSLEGNNAGLSDVFVMKYLP